MKSADPVGVASAMIGVVLIIVAVIAIWWDRRKK